MLKIKLIINDRDLQCSYLPRWYGIAYRQWECRRTVLYPIPINIIVGCGMRVTCFFYRLFKYSLYKNQLSGAYERGWGDGDAHGYKQGVDNTDYKWENTIRSLLEK